MAKETIKVPDIGGAEDVDVIELCVAEGDTISAEDSIIVLESDKASMDIPTPLAGKVVKFLVKEGDKVSEGSPIAELETDGAGDNGAAGDDKPAASEPKEQSKAAPADETQGKSASGAERPVTVPDIGGAEDVDVIEVTVKVGDQVAEGDSLIVLESDKASMDIPSPAAGKVLSISIKEGDKASQGTPILVLATTGGSAASETPKEAATAPAQAQSSSGQGGGSQEVKVPDIGGSENVDVIEVVVSEGDQVNEGDSLIVLESDKASMEVPSPVSGKVVSLAIKAGDKASMGTLIGTFEVSGGTAAPASPTKTPAQPQPATKEAPKAAPATPAASSASTGQPKKAGAEVYAGPSVRKLARQMGVDLGEVSASGPRGRVIKDDVKAFVKTVMEQRSSGGAVSSGSGNGIPAVPAIDFAQFGEIELKKMSKIKKVTAQAMSRSWLNVPHVTQFDDVDITEMEEFRKSMKMEAEQAGVKLTPLPFLVKACAAALKAEPSFNVSMHADGEHIVHKHYIHIGMAVDTPNGLVVPVIRDADQKGLFEIAAETVALAKKARDGKLMPKDMQGGCFTISSLGAMGGTGFTPIVNAPEVAILGVSRAETKPHWDGSNFVPRLKLPLSLSYDHRAINGGDAGRFFTYLNSVLMDIRRLLL